MTGYLSRDAILDADDLSTDVVQVPEWGGAVLVRSLTGRERDEFEAGTMRFGKDGSREMRLSNLRARFVALVIVDEQGNRLFADTDVKRLGQKSAAALQRVWEAGRKLSGLSDEDVEELVEDFDADQSGDSTSG
ncbi:MAG: hypothetical protein ACOC9R_05430 [bacterium]